MSKGMLGLLPLAEVQGVMDDIEAKLAGDEGLVYLTQLKKFARRESCWLAQLIYPTDLNPATFIGDGWNWADTDADARSLALPKVDFSKVLFETCLGKGEERITGEEKLRRLMAAGGIRLDPRFGVTLFKEEGQMTLECLYRERGITYLDFFGRILVGQSDGRYVFYLYRDDDGRWCWRAYWLGNGWHGRAFSARLAS